ncbi:MAG: DUF362 domain-containing protein [Planctomycetia bacterium]|nr:DUF362 domain-containing protein [Planctomycetia bacterium]
MSNSLPWHGVTRRGFLLGATAGLAGGVLGSRYLPLLLPGRPSSPEASTKRSSIAASDSMPGRYPGRVVEVRHPHAVSPDNIIDADAVNAVVDRGMADLTGYEPGDTVNAWGSLFDRDDVVGIKVNPVGRKALPGEGGRVPNAVGSISSFELVVKVVRCLIERGIPAKNIIVFERYANEFCDAGYKSLVERELPGVRWLCSALSYSNFQLDIRGRDPDCAELSSDVSRNVVGYDPDVFTTMGFCLPSHSARDDRRFRSHLSLIVSRMISKMITLPVLKDHRSAGVTLALKNMSHGMNNNVARSHLAGIAHGVGDGGKVLGPNQCNTFIPQCVSQQRLRDKATLHILDGLIGVYEGGPGCWNRTWGTWRHKGLFFATDPVALDHVCWDVIDEKRAAEGWAPVERMGYLYQTPATQPASAITTLAGRDLLGGAALATATKIIIEGRGSEAFNVRQPDHVVLAGQLQLGVFDRERISYSRSWIGI